VRGDLLAPIETHVDLLVANLPYVRSADLASLQPEVRDFEPIAALDGGPDGLKQIRRLLRQAPHYLSPGGALCLEFGDGQAREVEEVSRAAFPTASCQEVADLAGRPRVAAVRT
jgi:release factor glutamine methyltransferase